MSESVPFAFPNALSRAVYFNKYSRFDHDKGRREVKQESDDRTLEFLNNRFIQRGGVWQPGEFEEIQLGVYTQAAMPSMRLYWSAGPALERNHIMAYNCAFMAINRLRAFAEALYILMSGTGVGYSVEGQYVSDLPKIKKAKRNATIDTFVVPDTTEGWADALDLGIESWWNGRDVRFDVSEVRPEGTILKTKGGRASGPAPLVNALRQIRDLILASAGRNATTVLAHDIMCLIAQIVVVGGIRRASLISLFDRDDTAMRMSKHGQFWNSTPWRAMSNNSIAYDSKPTNEELLTIWKDMIAGKSGEPGIFNRGAFNVGAPRRKAYEDVGCNPCGEILLRDREFCNLSEVVCRPDDNRERLIEKVKLATKIGTIQASLTDFPYITPKWRENCEEEALLGVSLTGQMTCEAVRDTDVMRALKRAYIKTNASFAERIDVSQSVAIGTGKPSGTLSLFAYTSSGLHTWWDLFFIRRMRLNTQDPQLKLYRDLGYTVNVDPVTPGTYVVDFLCKAPDGAITRHDLTALQQLEHWKNVKINYTEHNPSATIYVRENEWIQVLAWIDEHWNIVGGLSFLPSTDHVYPLAPYESLTEEQYNELMKTYPQVSDEEFSRLLATYETEDNTTGAAEYACSSGVCEIAAA